MAESIGKFQILGELGKGAHSTIYHIKRLSDDKQFALKVVPYADEEDQKFLDQAQHEYEVGRQLDHPNLIKVHALEKQRDWFFRVRKVSLLIEYVNGKTLDQVKGLTMPRLVQVFEKAANGLMHMHRRNIYHADLKPNNIMLSKAGKVKILDYGLAWLKGVRKDRVQGTPEYMAPEQVINSIANERSDIYNLGATMYRLTTWRLPPSVLSDSNDKPISAKTFAESLQPVQELAPKAPAELCKLIHRCLSYKPERRPERVNEVIEVLNALIEKLVQTDEDNLEALGWQ
jgi:serine/threonine protein kinase